MGSDPGREGGSAEDRPTVLVVDDEPEVAETYSLYLSESYDVRTATDGDEALSMMDSDVEVVLLDRRMPSISGDEALAEIRDRGYDCRVAMVTAVDPDVDIVDMAFDDYLTKPITRDALLETVDRLLTLADYDDRIREEFSLARKRATLKSELSEEELQECEEYRELTDRLDHSRTQSAKAVATFDHEALSAAFEDPDR